MPSTSNNAMVLRGLLMARSVVRRKTRLQIGWSTSVTLFEGGCKRGCTQAARSFGDSSRMQSRKPVQASSKRSSTCNVSFIECLREYILQYVKTVGLHILSLTSSKPAGPPAQGSGTCSASQESHIPAAVTQLASLIHNTSLTSSYCLSFGFLTKLLIFFSCSMLMRKHSVGQPLSNGKAPAPVPATLAFMPQPLGIGAPLCSQYSTAMRMSSRFESSMPTR